MQTLLSGWTSSIVVTEKVSVVDYAIQLRPEGSSKVIHVDQLILDLCHQDRTNWIRDELARKMDDKVVNVGTDPIRPQQITVGVKPLTQIPSSSPMTKEFLLLSSIGV